MKISKIFKKILSIGTPPEKDVLYKHVVKKKVPNESAEQLTLTDFKKSLKNIFSHEDERIEFSRGTPSPPVKMAAKKTPAKKKTVAKKTKTTTKKSATSTKTTATKKPVTKKSTDSNEKSTTKKTTTKKKTTVATKTAAKKPVEKKVPAKKTIAKKPVAKKAVTKKSVEKKPAEKKVVAKKPVIKKPAAKKLTKKVAESKTKTTTTTKKAPASKTATEKKTKAAPRGAKKAAKIALYAKDITKHYGEVDEDFLAIIVKNLGPSIYKRDAELVSCSDPKELDTVRKNFLIKKLGIDAGQKVLDAAIQDVCEELKATRTKYRATFYYRLAKKFKKESFLS